MLQGSVARVHFLVTSRYSTTYPKLHQPDLTPSLTKSNQVESKRLHHMLHGLRYSTSTIANSTIASRSQVQYQGFSTKGTIIEGL